MNQKTLYILRHAKTETGNAAQEDHERAINERGIEAARLMGKYLARHGILPDQVLCSTAERATQTWGRRPGRLQKTAARLLHRPALPRLH